MASIPQAFCWTRIGVEAGQRLSSILERKEQERAANRGTFFWGIGNPIGPSIPELLRRCLAPEVLFSPVKSAPRAHDSHPEAVAVWTKAECLDGSEFDLPPVSLITSRFDLGGLKNVHYALVCSSSTPLVAAESVAALDIGELQNLLSSRPVGASQVTAVVSYVRGLRSISTYPVVLRAMLEPPYFLRLRAPVPLGRSDVGEAWEAAVRGRWGKNLAACPNPLP